MPRREATARSFRLLGFGVTVFWGSDERWVAWVASPDDRTHYFIGGASSVEALNLAHRLIYNLATEGSPTV